MVAQFSLLRTKRGELGGCPILPIRNPHGENQIVVQFCPLETQRGESGNRSMLPSKETKCSPIGTQRWKIRWLSDSSLQKFKGGESNECSIVPFRGGKLGCHLIINLRSSQGEYQAAADSPFWRYSKGGNREST